jgi:hypothetical protein
VRKCFFELLGLEKTYTYLLYHKCHIGKGMAAVAFTSFEFTYNTVNDGKGVKLGIKPRPRDESCKERDENGSIQYDGEIIRENGDAYPIHCNVAVSDEGNLKNQSSRY